MLLYLVMVIGVEAGFPLELNKGPSSKFRLGSKVRQETPEEGWRTHQPKRFEYSHKDDDNSLKNLTDEIMMVV